MTTQSKSNKKKSKSIPLSIRIQENTKEILQEYAEEYGLKFSSNPSISQLLDKIGNKDLVIVPKEKLGMHKPMKEYYNANFQITVEDYPGALTKVASIFRDWNVSIIGIETATPDQSGYFDIIARLNKDIDADHILQALQELTLNDIWKYAEDTIISLNNLNNKDEITEYKNKKLLVGAQCSTSIQVKAEARIGLLTDIALQVAQQGINLLSVFRKVDAGDLSFTHLHLKWSTLEKIQKVIEDIRNIPGVEDVYHTDVNEIIKRFTRIRLSEIQKANRLQKN